MTLRDVLDDLCELRVRGAGLNGADMLQRKGGYPAPPGSPTTARLASVSRTATCCRCL